MKSTHKKTKQSRHLSQNNRLTQHAAQARVQAMTLEVYFLTDLLYRLSGETDSILERLKTLTSLIESEKLLCRET